MATTDALSINELAEHVWERAGEDDDVTLSLLLDCPGEWPWDRPMVLAGSAQPYSITALQRFELAGALAEQALEDGWAAEDVLRAFADGLDPVPR
jgi:hypothetical protein